MDNIHLFLIPDTNFYKVILVNIRRIIEMIIVFRGNRCKAIIVMNHDKIVVMSSKSGLKSRLLRGYIIVVINHK